MKSKSLLFCAALCGAMLFAHEADAGDVLRGAFPLLCTPWTKDCALDCDVLVREAKFVSDNGVGGVIWPTADMMRGPHLHVLKELGVFSNTYTRRRAKEGEGDGKKWVVDEVKLTDSEKAEIEWRMKVGMGVCPILKQGDNLW